VSLLTNVTIANQSIITASIAATDIKCSTTGTVPAVVTVTAGGTGTCNTALMEQLILQLLIPFYNNSRTGEAYM
jgi:hypothetical protein